MKNIFRLLLSIVAFFSFPVFGTVSVTLNMGFATQLESSDTIWSNVNAQAHTTQPTLGIALAAGADINCDFSQLLQWQKPKVQEFFQFDLGHNFIDPSSVPSGYAQLTEGDTIACTMNHKTIARSAFGGGFSGLGFSISWSGGDTGIDSHTFIMIKPIEVACEGEVPGDDPTCYDEPVSPIVFDFDNDGFHFTDLDLNPVAFDIDNDGRRERTAWTSSRSLDSFLALDRNGNGIVDDGGELFGNATRLHNGHKAPNGYEALREFDLLEFGGNGDWVIDKDDYIYHHLLLWVDINHNGYSEEKELWPLSKYRHMVINLDYAYDPVYDDSGNFLAFFSNALIGDPKRKSYLVESTDVFFRVHDYE